MQQSLPNTTLVLFVNLALHRIIRILELSSLVQQKASWPTQVQLFRTKSELVMVKMGAALKFHVAHFPTQISVLVVLDLPL